MILRRRALDVEVLLRVEDPRLADLVEHSLGDLLAARTPSRSESVVDISGLGPWSVRTPDQTRDALSMERALTQTLTAVNMATVTDTPHLAVHAAVVSRNGHSLVMPARSGTGKSTLTACLLQQGWRYVSDEALALDWTTGTLMAYPRSLALSPWSLAAVDPAGGLAADGETLFRASDLGAEVDKTPGPVRHVILLNRVADENDVSLTVADRNDALVELLSRGFTHRHNGGRALILFADMLRKAQVLRLNLGHPATAATLLTEACERL